MNNSLIQSIGKRRSQYSIGRNLSASRAEIEDIIKQAVRLSPSAFNSQSARIVILFGAESDKLWDITREALRKIVPADKFAPTAAKIDSFAAGAGTVLFYEDQDVVKTLQGQFPLYADNFPVWSEHSSGIAQFAVWSALAVADIGASLQHYNPLIDDEVARTWNIPATWTLRSQMPFGSNEKPFPEKTFIEDSVRFRVFG